MFDLTAQKIDKTNFASLAAEILRNGTALRFQARGASMRPFIRDGDVLEIVPTGPPVLRRGDIVLCHSRSERVLVHRIVGIERESDRITYVTQGDALARPDGWISGERVLGRAVAAERQGRRIALDAGPQRWLGLLWIGLSPLSRRLYGVLATLTRRMRHWLEYASRPPSRAVG